MCVQTASTETVLRPRCVSNPQQQRILLVEHRDEVFARLASDLECHGFVVDRVTTASEFVTKCTTSSPSLILMNRELSSEQSGWLLIAKGSLYGPRRRIWLYTATPGARDGQWAELLGIDHVLYYQGNLWCLSGLTIRQLQFHGMCGDRPWSTRRATLPCLAIRFRRMLRPLRRDCLMLTIALLAACFLAFGHRATRDRAIVQFRSLACEPCTSQVVAEIASICGVVQSRIDRQANRVVVELIAPSCGASQRLWEAAGRTCLEPTSVIIAQSSRSPTER